MVVMNYLILSVKYFSTLLETVERLSFCFFLNHVFAVFHIHFFFFFFKFSKSISFAGCVLNPQLDKNV